MRTRLAVAFLIGVLALPAQARMFEYLGPNGITYGFVMPPERYREMPFNGGELIVRDLSAEDTLKTCSMLARKQEGSGCAMFNPSGCTILLNKEMPPDMYEATKEHEIAHCKGWPADHPLD